MVILTQDLSTAFSFFKSQIWALLTLYGHSMLTVTVASAPLPFPPHKDGRSGWALETLTGLLALICVLPVPVNVRIRTTGGGCASASQPQEEAWHDTSSSFKARICKPFSVRWHRGAYLLRAWVSGCPTPASFHLPAGFPTSSGLLHMLSSHFLNVLRQHLINLQWESTRRHHPIPINSV
jgi:hypothetical protein